MITVFADTLTAYRRKDACLPLSFYCWDGGDAYTQVLAEAGARHIVPGALLIIGRDAPAGVSEFGASGDQVRIIGRWQEKGPDSQQNSLGSVGRWTAEGYVWRDERWQEMAVQIVPLKDDLHSRAKGLIETGVLAEARVLIAGLGSVGSFVSQDLVQAGVGHLILCDYDRVEVPNVMRQNIDTREIGRYKTKAAGERLRHKNPDAHIETHEVKIAWQTKEWARPRVRRSDFVIGPVDQREPRLVLNELCVEEGKPLILMGADHRAYRLQVFFMRRPGVDPCYQCFLMSLPAEVRNPGFSELEQGDWHDYAEHPVSQVTPGLSTDIAPMITMTSKLGTSHLANIMAEDLRASFYTFLNRREPGTLYEGLEPLGFGVGQGMRILRWYGEELQRHPACPVCGDFEGEMAKAYGISLSENDAGTSECETAQE